MISGAADAGLGVSRNMVGVPAVKYNGEGRRDPLLKIVQEMEFDP